MQMMREPIKNPGILRPMPARLALPTFLESLKSRGRAFVAQLDRATVFGTVGWGFESLRMQLKVEG